MQEVEKHQFMSIKIKKQTYQGRPSITIYLKDSTKKVHG